MVGNLDRKLQDILDTEPAGDPAQKARESTADEFMASLPASLHEHPTATAMHAVIATGTVLSPDHWDRLKDDMVALIKRTRR